MKLDCVFITDAISKYNYSLLINAMAQNCNDDFTKPIFLSQINYQNCCIITINTYSSDLFSKTGIIKARKQFLSALKYAIERFETKTILLAASTKRLFGKEAETRVNLDGTLDSNGFTLQELYPDVLFTNGDNGTSVIFNAEIDRLLLNANICNDGNSVLINGLGLLGTNALNYILDNNYYPEQIKIISNHTKELKEIIEGKSIEVFDSISSIPRNEAKKITAIINCTHNPGSIITVESINYIQDSKPIHVIDVAVPYGFPEDEFNKCKGVIRQDGGNAYISDGLEFFFNPKICGLTDNVVYGCFAEAMCISAYLKENPEKKDFIKSYDYFDVNNRTKEFVKVLFEKYSVGIAPVPYNFMKKPQEG